jgi:hypothetical protein
VCSIDNDDNPKDLYILSSDLVFTEFTNHVSDTSDMTSRKESTCVLDSGCSKHMTPDESLFKNPPQPCEPKTFRAANRNTFTASRKGTASLNINGHIPLTLPDVLFVPELSNTLISIGCLDNAGYTVTFGGGQGVIRDKNGNTVGTVPKSNGAQ